VRGWNEIARSCGLRPVRRLTPRQADELHSRLADPSWRVLWPAALAAIPTLPALSPKGAVGTVASFAWFIRPGTVEAVLSGRFAWRRAWGVER